MPSERWAVKERIAVVTFAVVAVAMFARFAFIVWHDYTDGDLMRAFFPVGGLLAMAVAVVGIIYYERWRQ